ncbi:hypothetical protein [Pseudacidovorax sp. NFM-22]|uniref:hypothetical protein n=1 Tax=Pseudacidovorax sp. NFM-22 TaxID=2744469 RepID=UPI001F4646D9|nr:hypothetical protein [Pseudacidovorax sp. NFM-22]
MTLRYQREGFAQTRDALAWAGAYAPDFKFGLTLADVFAGLEHGYESVRSLLRDPERIAQWEASRSKLRAAHELFKAGDVHRGKLTLQEAEEGFTSLRRIKGKTPTRQELGDTEHGGNELDE